MPRRKSRSCAQQSARNETPETARRREEAGLRALCYFNLFWMDCRAKPCVRARDCRGDARACFARNWSALDADERAFRRDYVQALRARKAPAAAADHALACALARAKTRAAARPVTFTATSAPCAPA